MSGDHLKILIVEDEPMLAYQLEDELAEAGHEVVGCAMSSGEAIALAERTQPDLVLLDIQLSDGRTGLSAARRLYARRRAIVFLTASARTLPQDLAGAVGVIEKPWSTSGLQSAVRFLSAGLSRGASPPPPGCLRLAAGCAPASSGLYMFG